MDLLLKLVHMFNTTVSLFIGYIPQLKDDVFEILKQGWVLLGSVLGANIQKIINIIIDFITKYFSLAYTFLVELIKKLTESA